MPVYEYEHLESACPAGRVMEIRQSIHDPELAVCPHCGGPVKKNHLPGLHQQPPKTNSELKDMGFTKLVRRGRRGV